jgi:hypothetical protein
MGLHKVMRRRDVMGFCDAMGLRTSMSRREVFDQRRKPGVLLRYRRVC